MWLEYGLSLKSSLRKRSDSPIRARVISESYDRLWLFSGRLIGPPLLLPGQNRGGAGSDVLYPVNELTVTVGMLDGGQV